MQLYTSIRNFQTHIKDKYLSIPAEIALMWINWNY